MPDDGAAEAEPSGDLVDGERPVGAGVPRDQVGERVGDRLAEHVGRAGRDGYAEPVAQAADVLDRGPALLACDPHLDDASGGGQHRERLVDVEVACPLADLGGRQRAEQAHQVGHALGVVRAPVGRQPLELGLDLGEHLGVEQLAQLGPAEQLGEQSLVERECGRPALRDRGVALVDELGDVPEQQAAGVRRGLGGRDVDDLHLASLDPAHQADQGRQVVDVLEALADRLEHDREGRVAGGHLEQRRGPLPLLPQRRATAGVAAGEQQRTRGALAEAGGEQRGPADLAGDQVVDLLGLEDDELARGRVGVGLGDPDHDPVVGGHRLAVDPEPLAQPRVDRQRPGRVHRDAVRRVDDQPPVAELVAEPLDQQGAVAGEHVGGLDLLGEVADQVGRGPLVEAVLAGARGGLRLREGSELAGEASDRGTELGRAAEGVALPERQPARHARRRRDQDPVMGDVLDPPARGAEREHVADPGLVDHLLVELADPSPRPLASDEEDAEQAAVGDGAAAGDGQPLRAGAAGERAGDAVPDDAGAQLGELVGGIAAGQQVEGRLEGAARELGERRRPAEQLVEVVDGPRVERGGGDDLLGEHVERVGGHPQRLDRAAAHPLDGDGGLRQVAAVLGEEHAAGHLADLVAGAADPLQRAGDAGRRLDLDDQVDRAHVDAELEAAGRDHAGESAALEVVLDDRALLLRHRAVVGLRDHRRRAVRLTRLRHDLGRRLAVALGTPACPVGGDLVQPRGQPLREPARVGEDDGRAVLADQVGDPLLDVRPDAGAALRVAGLLVVRRRGRSCPRPGRRP